MLLTITPNPAIDRTLYVPHLTVGEVHRTGDVQVVAGGKGLNVTRAALTVGGQVLTTAPLGGHPGRHFADLAAGEGLPTDWYWRKSGDTRTCLLINHHNNDTTVINESGSPLSSQDWQGFTAHIQQLARNAPAVAFSGSLPPGIDPLSFSAFTRSLTAEWIFLDTSRAALGAALTQPERLCIKVNRGELLQGLSLDPAHSSIKQLIEAGQRLLQRGAELVVVTLGAEGALAIAPQECWHIIAPQINVVSSVGSGDSLLAGLAVALIEGKGLAAALAFGVACGTANVSTPLPGHFEKKMVKKLLAKIEVTGC